MKAKGEGGYLIRKMNVLMVVAFAKSLLVLKTGKKKLFIQNSYCLDKNYGSVFRYRGKWFGFFFFFLAFHSLYLEL